MPHHFVNRLRSHPFAGEELSRRDQVRWESASAVIYLLGGVLFVWGSVRFFPSLESQAENRGAWIFFAGSLQLFDGKTYKRLLKGPGCGP